MHFFAFASTMGPRLQVKDVVFSNKVMPSDSLTKNQPYKHILVHMFHSL